ncbi:hypothetical protein G6321_00011905 [Bradyrhizobium barranii subsp. barranii]|uniref:Uncharacterized protein n=1 Tax=Bradyrhizobium barranii subsp. barranii TaxID=2823807 RepID=A0A7Z0TNA5_9BRAD|nr:hypothetical protein [Bradyrhizobium barranii]UGX95795.1 hypothetical protein G6321_00011905 [Bradyrhizobium barranii subsp. barranii]
MREKEHQAEREDSAPDELREMMTEREVLDTTRLSRSALHRLEKKDGQLRACVVYIAPNTKRFWRDLVIRWQKVLAEKDHRNPNRGRGPGRRPRAVGEAVKAEA